MDGAQWFLEYKEMLEEIRMDETGHCALKIMNLLQLGNLRSGHNLGKEGTSLCNHVGKV